LDEEKFFIVSWGEITGRLDAFYWQPRFHAIDAIFNKRKEWTARLGAVSHGLTNGDHGGVQYTEEGVRYLRGQSVTELGLDLDKDAKYISSEDHARMVRAEVVPGDVLYTIAGSIGNACVVSGVERANINQAIVKIRPSEGVLSQYLTDFLNSSFGKLQSRRIANGGVQLNINFSEVKALRILIPPKEIQHSFVVELNDAKKTYKEALASAKRLLSSIDDYLLTELGITLPPEPENTLASRIFTSQWRELAGWRFDPDMAVYSRHTRTSKFELSRLKDHMLTSPQYGANQRGVERTSGDVPRYVQITDVNEFGELSDGLGVAAEVAEDKYLLVSGDLLFARSGNTVGKTYLHENDGDEKHIFAGYMIRFRLNPETLLPAYAFSYTLCSAYKEWCQAVQRAAGQPNINAEEYKGLLIPVPPIDKQSEIANRVFEIRNQAKLLRQQAESELEAAKRRIEAMLLGDVA